MYIRTYYGVVNTFAYEHRTKSPYFTKKTIKKSPKTFQFPFDASHRRRGMGRRAAATAAAAAGRCGRFVKKC